MKSILLTVQTTFCQAQSNSFLAPESDWPHRKPSQYHSNGMSDLITSKPGSEVLENGTGFVEVRPSRPGTVISCRFCWTPAAAAKKKVIKFNQCAEKKKTRTPPTIPLESLLWKICTFHVMQIPTEQSSHIRALR